MWTESNLFMKLPYSIYLCISTSMLLLSGCANTYYCTLNSRGVSPSEKTYYVAPQDSTLKYSLEFNEYAEILKEHLNSSGYEEAYSKTAALRIELGYGMKDAYLESSSTSSGIVTNTYNNVNINSKSTSHASANLSALKYGNYSVTYNVPIGTNQGTTTVTRQESTNIGPGITTYGTASESTTHTYKIPLFVVIRAFERLTNEPVWEVVVEDDLDRETQIQTVMPWIFLSAKDYFGRSSNGEQTPHIRNTRENREMYQLVWPY